MAEPYLRIEVVHDDGLPAVYHVTQITINQPFRLHSDTGVTLRAVEEDRGFEITPESRRA